VDADGTVRPTVATAVTPRETLLRLSACVTAGLVTGFLVGGVGGRLAMLVLRLTSDASVRGRLSDDGFTIGVLSSETVFLLVAATAVGAFGGVLYLGVRRLLPVRHRAWTAAAFGAVTGGALLVHTDGIDFTALSPVPLAIAFFVAIPAGYGGGTSVLAERFLRSGAFSRTRALVGLVPVAAFALLGPLGVAVLAVTIVGTLLAPRALAPGLARVLIVFGRLAMLAIAIVAAVDLAGDVTTLL